MGAQNNMLAEAAVVEALRPTMNCLKLCSPKWATFLRSTLCRRRSGLQQRWASDLSPVCQFSTDLSPRRLPQVLAVAHPDVVVEYASKNTGLKSLGYAGKRQKRVDVFDTSLVRSMRNGKSFRPPGIGTVAAAADGEASRGPIDGGVGAMADELPKAMSFADFKKKKSGS